MSFLSSITHSALFSVEECNITPTWQSTAMYFVLPLHHALQWLYCLPGPALVDQYLQFFMFEFIFERLILPNTNRDFSLLFACE